MNTPKSTLAMVYELLDSTDLSAREIADGARVGRKWVSRVRRRELEDPGSQKIERVYHFLLASQSKETAA